MVVFKEREKVGNIIDALHNTEHHGFPVVDMNETIATDEDQQNFGLLKVRKLFVLNLFNQIFKMSFQIY